MIEGLQVRMTSGQILQVAEQARDRHLEKAKRYSARASEMKEAGDDPAMSVSNDKSTIESFERRVGEHRVKASEFQVMIDYLPPNEVFQLTWEDLRRLELVGSY